MSNWQPPQNIYLLGMMGSGKSTIGQLLSRQLGYQFIDTDRAIVENYQDYGDTSGEIFQVVGEEQFREWETQELEKIANTYHCVVATGGGIVLSHYNWQYLYQGFTIWIDPLMKILWSRLKGDRTRPLLQTNNPRSQLQQLMAERQSLYARSNLRVTINTHQSPKKTVEQIINELIRE
jgi:shikimate kinase